jgi:hypothetical protein
VLASPKPAAGPFPSASLSRKSPDGKFHPAGWIPSMLAAVAVLRIRQQVGKQATGRRAR